VTGSYLAFRENVNEQYLTKVGPYHLPAGPSYELSRSESIEAIFGLHYEQGIVRLTHDYIWERFVHDINTESLGASDSSLGKSLDPRRPSARFSECAPAPSLLV
jgi:hypothetical protein